MGGLLSSSRVNPNPSVLSPQNSLLSWGGDVSRVNFKFLRKLQTFGVDDESVLWLASNTNDPNQPFLVRQIDKCKVYDHKRIAPILRELQLFTQSSCEFISKAYFAFQDYHSLYLVSEALQSLSFEYLLQHHIFTENESRYVVAALLSIIDYVHRQGFAITELSPANIHIDIRTGRLKLVQFANPAPIDSFCAANAVSEVCPYSAPEILYRDRVTAECDFYSLGLIMYEMMTQNAVPQCRGEGYCRSEILKETIEIEKSHIPEDWHTEASDFLIKLLIKNPAMRLGRFGSFQVKRHAWLKELDIGNSSKNRIRLSESEKGVRLQAKASSYKIQFQKSVLGELSKDYFFQSLFQEYSYKRPLELREQEGRGSAESKSQQLQDNSHWKLAESVM